MYFVVVVINLVIYLFVNLEKMKCCINFLLVLLKNKLQQTLLNFKTDKKIFLIIQHLIN